MSETPRTDAEPLRYMTVVYEIVDEAEWRKTNPLRYEHNGLSAVTVSVGDAIELLDEAEAKVERLRSQRNRAVEIAEEFWNNQKQAVLVYHEELADELAALKSEITE